MSDTSPASSIRPDKPLDPAIAEILRQVDTVARDRALPYFVAGATARDLLLTNVHGLETKRATRDVDFGFAVNSWAQFDLLKDGLQRTGNFRPDLGRAHRLYFSVSEVATGIPVDIIPFDGVEQEGEIAWPPDRAIRMSVVAFVDVLHAAVDLTLAPDNLTVKVASLPGLALLKLLAWADRGNADPRDAIDLLTLSRRYFEAGQQERTYTQHLDVLEWSNHDPEVAGAVLLGHDAWQIASADTRQFIHNLANSPERLDRLQM
ncbi:MAG TPA: nucleotidyl transferase AbiEii/AbiGii toxin family protein [Burkholderiales bacterium]|nr:nucleotidyl transferase AbiEii/AbiGii toxin family protein [Burkholderiales bacterium]